MGIFWDLMQESKIQDQQKQADNLEDRIQVLEAELKQTKEVLQKTLEALELHLNKDIDGDDIIGE